MRSRALPTTAALLLSLATAAPASAATLHDPAPEGRTTTVRAACGGGGRIALTVDQSVAGTIESTAVASDLPADSVWVGELDVTSSTGSGGGASFDPRSPEPDGTMTMTLSQSLLIDPTVDVDLHTQDGQMACNVRARVDRQYARTSCSRIERRVSVTALQNNDKLDVSTRLSNVRPKSAWNVRVSVKSPHASERATASRHASADGVVRAAFSFGYAANRTIKVAFANPAGKGCELFLGARRLPTG
jgi:hypothetical protein